MTVLSALIAVYAVGTITSEALGPAELKAKMRLSPISMYAHILGGAIALLIGPFQLNAAIRKRWLSLHRNPGRIYLVAVAASGLAGLSMAVVSNGGFVSHFGFATLSVLWLYSGSMAWLRIRAGDVQAHRTWMIRNFALTFAAVTLRLWLPLLVAMSDGDFDVAYQTVSWVCWVPNLIVAEWYFLRRSVTQSTRSV
jgi:uncharacterized membrane protein